MNEQTATPPNPWMQTAGLATSLLGTGVSAYGAYKQSQQANRQYQLAVQAWQAEQARQRRMDAQNQQQQAVNNSLNAGQYAGNLMEEIEDPYIQYARALGLGG